MKLLHAQANEITVGCRFWNGGWNAHRSGGTMAGGLAGLGAGTCGWRGDGRRLSCGLRRGAALVWRELLELDRNFVGVRRAKAAVA